MQQFHPQTRTPTSGATSRQPIPLDLPAMVSCPQGHLRPIPPLTLITGATGFVGGACAIEAMESGKTQSLLFLVRASSQEEGLTRLLESLGRFESKTAPLSLLTVDQIIVGDLADVAAFSDDPRLDRVTHVLNSAAVASFGNHPGIWPVNVVGTVAFAKRMAAAPRLKRFVHIGTAMACGAGQTSPVQESWQLPETPGHLVPYTASKAEAERQMRAIPGLPLVVARPSIVVGHSRLGCKPSSSIFWVFRMAQDLGRFMCSLDETVDVIPVDYCAQALMMLTYKEHIASDLYHISAGDGSASFRAIEAAMAEARHIPSQVSTWRQIRECDIPSIVPDFKARLGIANRRLVTKAVKLYGGFSLLNYQFDNHRLIAEGFAQPPSFPSYIGHCIRSTEGLPLLEQMMSDFK
ncbi:SDR family oxidoreductase [uncultured Nevskia sp.]|uniref:SDR family oxidoreductase n=1 Tax=uncultured Nevskia sp. TaxID=228950 RepID=UPI0025EB42FE|nr:SDR family oxidoreductase [uncultured Nevskia sp.]